MDKPSGRIAWQKEGTILRSRLLTHGMSHAATGRDEAGVPSNGTATHQRGMRGLSALQNVGEFEDHASEGQNHGSFFDLFAALEEDTATDDLIG
jgi:hypothetical protein